MSLGLEGSAEASKQGLCVAKDKLSTSIADRLCSLAPEVVGLKVDVNTSHLIHEKYITIHTDNDYQLRFSKDKKKLLSDSNNIVDSVRNGIYRVSVQKEEVDGVQTETEEAESRTET